MVQTHCSDGFSLESAMDMQSESKARITMVGGGQKKQRLREVGMLEWKG